MTDKIVAAVLLGITAWLWFYVRDQDMYKLLPEAYGLFSLLTVAYLRRAKG